MFLVCVQAALHVHWPSPHLKRPPQAGEIICTTHVCGLYLSARWPRQGDLSSSNSTLQLPYVPCLCSGRPSRPLALAPSETATAGGGNHLHDPRLRALPVSSVASPR